MIDARTGIQRIVDERARQIAQEGWTPEHDDEPVKPVPHAEPANADGMTERERDAGEIFKAIYPGMTTPLSRFSPELREAFALGRDKAETIFKFRTNERAKRAEDERDRYAQTVASVVEVLPAAVFLQGETLAECCGRLVKERDAAQRELAELAYQRDGARAEVERLNRAAKTAIEETGAMYNKMQLLLVKIEQLETEVCSAEPVIEYFQGETERQRAEVERLTARNAELVETLRKAKGHITNTDMVLWVVTGLLARIDAEAAGKQEAPKLTVRAACRKRVQLGGPDAQCLEHALTMTEKERDAAEAKGRRDAFREAFREAGVVPLACAEGFIAWLRKAAGK